MRGPTIASALVGVAFLALAGCGADTAPTAPPSGDQARCTQDAVDCNDTPDGAADCDATATTCDDTGDASGTPGSMAMCAQGVTDCNDMVEPVDDGAGEPQGIAEGEPNGQEPDAPDTFDSDREREAARSMLGMAEADLSADVRIARRGEQTFVPTADHVIGRKTVQLDADADGVYRVTTVTVELPEGDETYTA